MTFQRVGYIWEAAGGKCTFLSRSQLNLLWGPVVSRVSPSVVGRWGWRWRPSRPNCTFGHSFSGGQYPLISPSPFYLQWDLTASTTILLSIYFPRIIVDSMLKEVPSSSRQRLNGTVHGTAFVNPASPLATLWPFSSTYSPPLLLSYHQHLRPYLDTLASLQSLLQPYGLHRYRALFKRKAFECFSCRTSVTLVVELVSELTSDGQD